MLPIYRFEFESLGCLYDAGEKASIRVSLILAFDNIPIAVEWLLLARVLSARNRDAQERFCVYIDHTGNPRYPRF